MPLSLAFFEPLVTPSAAGDRSVISYLVLKKKMQNKRSKLCAKLTSSFLRKWCKYHKLGHIPSPVDFHSTRRTKLVTRITSLQTFSTYNCKWTYVTYETVQYFHLEKGERVFIRGERVLNSSKCL